MMTTLMAAAALSFGALPLSYRHLRALPSLD